MPSVVFTGPSLGAERAQQLLPGARILGPAQCGDVYRATRLRPRAIVLIDGYFDQRLSVWHKELLFALSRGIRVYGAASMGALRAAELDGYGMLGHGAVYAQYQRGELEDDDEVAVAHEDQGHGYRRTSDALVDIRATLAEALAAQRIELEQHAALIHASKLRFYPERRFESAMQQVEQQQGTRLSQLRAWFEQHGLTEQKRADAEGVLQRVAAELQHGAPRPVRFHFQRTQYFRLLEQRLSRGS